MRKNGGVLEAGTSVSRTPRYAVRFTVHNKDVALAECTVFTVTQTSVERPLGHVFL